MLSKFTAGFSIIDSRSLIDTSLVSFTNPHPLSGCGVPDVLIRNLQRMGCSSWFPVQVSVEGSVASAGECGG